MNNEERKTYLLGLNTEEGIICFQSPTPSGATSFIWSIPLENGKEKRATGVWFDFDEEKSFVGISVEDRGMSFTHILHEKEFLDETKRSDTKKMLSYLFETIEKTLHDAYETVAAIMEERFGLLLSMEGDKKK